MNRKEFIKGALTSAAVSVPVAAAVSRWNSSSVSEHPKKEETAFDRVMRTGKIRGGYIIVSPSLVKDPNTGKFSGLVYEILEQATKLLNLKLEWTEEVSFANHVEGIRANRYDMICTSLYALPSLSKDLDFIGPFYYTGIGVYVRQDDFRFDGNLEAINDPGVTICSVDGTIPGVIADSDFPKARKLSLPQYTSYGENLLNVVNGKADVTFVEASSAHEFLASNPGSLKNISSHQPLRVFPNTFGIKKGEFKLQEMFNNVISHLLNNGNVEKILNKYERYPGSFFRVRRPYEIPVAMSA